MSLVTVQKIQRQVAKNEEGESETEWCSDAITLNRKKDNDGRSLGSRHLGSLTTIVVWRDVGDSDWMETTRGKFVLRQPRRDRRRGIIKKRGVAIPFRRRLVPAIT